VVASGLDQQSSYVAVAGLGDRAERAVAAGGVLGGNQTEVGADAVVGLVGRGLNDELRLPLAAAEGRV
jgi:hypothetical protein